MFTKLLTRSTVLASFAGLCFTILTPADANVIRDTGTIVMKSRKLDGPRMGVSVIGTKPITIDGKNIGPVMSQFGWQFEWMVHPESGGPAFITELIPFIGGVEYSIVVPSLSLVTGIRFPRGFEFGMGPHVSIHFNDDIERAVKPSLVLAAGHTFDISGVNIPLNVAMTNSSSGQSYSFLFGYAIPSIFNR